MGLSVVLTLADTPSGLLAQQSRWFCSAEGLLPPEFHPVPEACRRCSFRVAERGSLPRWGGGVAQRWLLQPLSSASKSASWGPAPRLPLKAVRQNQKAWRLPRGAVEPGGVSTVGSLSTGEAPLEPRASWARGRAAP